MDPNETLRFLLQTSTCADNAPELDTEVADLRDMQTHALNLIEWLAKGGFAPDWERILREHKRSV